MTMLTCEPAICSKCDNKQLYTKVLTWNTFINSTYPANNTCYKCGNKLNYEDIDINECSPFHREEIRFSKIYQRLGDINKSNSIKEKCEVCGSEKLSQCDCWGIDVPDEFKNDKSVRVAKKWTECSDCGHKKYLSVEECCENYYDYIRDGDNEYEYIVKKNKDFDKIMNEFSIKREIKFEKVKNELIQEGLITSDEEEEKYYREYYRKDGD